MKKIKRARSSITGCFVSKEYAKENPVVVVVETVKPKEVEPDGTKGEVADKK
jgi:hypothetical protein